MPGGEDESVFVAQCVRWVRTTFGGLRRTIYFALLCNPPKWDAPVLDLSLDLA